MPCSLVAIPPPSPRVRRKQTDNDNETDKFVNTILKVTNRWC